jgi:hypothetical protein
VCKSESVLNGLSLGLHRWTAGVVEAHPGVKENNLGIVEAHLGSLTPWPTVVEANLSHRGSAYEVMFTICESIYVFVDQQK